jgi:hypothetical protein
MPTSIEADDEATDARQHAEDGQRPDNAHHRKMTSMPKIATAIAGVAFDQVAGNPAGETR